MSASTRTRDGAPSVAALIMAEGKCCPHQVVVDFESAMKWAKENSVPFDGEAPSIDKINAFRKEKGLPGFKIDSLQRQSKSIVDQRMMGRSTPSHKRAASLLLVTSENELHDLIANHTGTLTRLITPQIAGWLLDLNTGNRSPYKQGVERFCQLLKSEQWQNTGEPIIIAREAILNDGQHRLMAIKQAGIAAELDVRFGVARAAFQATGTGKRRSAGDVLSIEGYSNTNCQAAIARLMYQYDSQKMGHLRDLVEASSILKIVETDERIGQIAARIQRHKMPLARSGAFGFALAIAARTAPIDHVFSFSDIAAGGLAQHETNPAWCLQKKFQDNASARERMFQEDVAALTVKAWNAWANDEAIQQLKLVPGDRTDAGFPRVIDWKLSKLGGDQTSR
jgi:hypothetical protein